MFLNGAIIGAVFYFPRALGLDLISPWGWIALTIVLALANWYAVDWVFPRRHIYRFFGRAEPLLSHRLRFARQIALFTTLIVSVAVTLVELLGKSDNASLIPSDAATPLAAITTAFLASLGWLYTRFEQEKADRARATQEAFKRFYGDTNISLQEIIKDLIGRYREETGFSDVEPLPLDAIDKPMKINTDKGSPDKVEMTLRGPLDRFFNELNKIAFGVRHGELDYHTVEMIMRPRYIEYNYIFFEYVRNQTNAFPIGETDFYRSNRRTWEHMLWLTSRLPLLKTDNLDWTRIVMPRMELSADDRIPAPHFADRLSFLPDHEVVFNALARFDRHRLARPLANRDKPKKPAKPKARRKAKSKAAFEKRTGNARAA